MADIDQADMDLVTVDEVRAFCEQIEGAHTFAEEAAIRLRRLHMANDGKIGGWPAGYVFSTESVAACALLADELDEETERMSEWARTLRAQSAYLWRVHGHGAREEA